MRRFIEIYAICALLVLLINKSAKSAEDYVALIEQKDYSAASQIIEKQIEEINATRVDDKKIPTDFITLNEESEQIDINKLFQNRKAEHYFLEEIPELYSLHLSAGKCFYELHEYDKALSHLYQSLRYRLITYNGEDSVFYLISQCCLKKGAMKGYFDSLETAYSINSRNLDYSLELGKALAQTRDKKRAIFHLARYAEGKGGDVTDISIYLLLAGLCEDTGNYLKTVDWYKKYIERNMNNGSVYFALGKIQFERTGDYEGSEKSLRKALKLLPSAEIYMISRSHECIADMKFNMLKWSEALFEYQETVKYQNLVLDEINKNDAEILKIDNEIRVLKAGLLKEKNFVKYNEYQYQMQEKERFLSEKRDKKYEYDKLNAGKSRWNSAVCCQNLKMYNEAIDFFRQAITFNYRSNEAREEIIKLQLKIKRGY